MTVNFLCDSDFNLAAVLEVLQVKGVLIIKVVKVTNGEILHDDPTS